MKYALILLLLFVSFSLYGQESTDILRLRPACEAPPPILINPVQYNPYLYPGIYDMPYQPAAYVIPAPYYPYAAPKVKKSTQVVVSVLCLVGVIIGLVGISQ